MFFLFLSYQKSQLQHHKHHFFPSQHIITMATVLPPASKRQKREALSLTQVQQDVSAILTPEDAGSFKARFVDSDGNQTDSVEIPLADATEKNVSLLYNTLLGRDRDDFVPYRFRIQTTQSEGIQYPSNLLDYFRTHKISPNETTITLLAEPQAVFRVQAVSRLAHKVRGHGQPILTSQFSPKSSSRLATGSGDHTARIWDADTGTPKFTLKGHTGWVLDVRWSPDGELLATCSMDKTLRIWDPETGTPVNRELRGHKDCVLMAAWEPYHLRKDGAQLIVSASRDGTARVWHVGTGRTEHVLSGHKGSVCCVKWGAGGENGTGQIYTGSHDKTIRVWNASAGTLVHELTGHKHWVNHIALSSEFVLRTGFFDHTKDVPSSEEAKRAKAKERFESAGKTERIISASDDLTMILWDPTNSGKKPVARLHGHQKAVNHVGFSPDGALIASTGWDNHTRIWSARDGSFMHKLLGHVAPVFQCAFSADSRLLATASRDTTVKVWNVRDGKLAKDLPGHEDEVYTVDWAPEGNMVCSGGKDKTVRMWRN
ncbi:YVTN repeat-like/Quino protein amine dehydrogenase [Phialemonium atrogriseum]|uniref:YVTN repeat-like/Quino protein amine dehydrogenase n=1 Tax=Phialemonium atrogriseum TaxID=1093897 RepID=A0AAJ0FJY0_9PEZI|nr:YVTN repeat-like/Quino protein amine dehydrogenase [Phialemonium atrogriseum]KAK1770442.1 YVTN repeat-like/Quino protein amine dehydrogenase [Phialemonium atrogriseum]